MKQFIDYINSSLPNEKGNELLYKFKRKKLEEMNKQYAEVMTRGINNSGVLIDLVISEHKNLDKQFEAYQNKKLEERAIKRNTILNIVGCATYFLVMIISFLGIGFSTHVWSPTWLIVADGALVLLAYGLSLAVGKISSMKRIFHVFARILLAIDVLIISVAVFLFCIGALHMRKGWLILIFGIVVAFVADAIFAIVKKNKLVMINVLVYIPFVATMLYIILSAIGVLSWNTGWLLIIAALIVNLVIVFIRLNINKKEKQEVIDAWQEN